MTEHKSLSMSVKSAAEGVAQAVFSRFNVIDSDGDVTLPGAFRSGVSVPISAYGHSSWTGTLPVGKATIRVTADKAIADCEFFLSTTGGRETFETVKELGALMQWSFGYDVEDSEFGKWDGRNVRILKKLIVHEVSPVLLGAGVGTQTLVGSVKSRDTVDPATRRELHAIKARLDAMCNEEAREIAARWQTYAVYQQFRDSTDFHYVSVSAPSLDHELAALSLAASCAREVGLMDLPLIKWFRPEDLEHRDYARQYGARDWDGFSSEKDVRGIFDRPTNTVWLRTDQSLNMLLRTVVHEMRHAAGGDEEAAQGYEKAWLTKLPRWS